MSSTQVLEGSLTGSKGSFTCARFLCCVSPGPGPVDEILVVATFILLHREKAESFNVEEDFYYTRIY